MSGVPGPEPGRFLISTLRRPKGPGPRAAAFFHLRWFCGRERGNRPVAETPRPSDEVKGMLMFRGPMTVLPAAALALGFCFTPAPAADSAKDVLCLLYT